MGKREEEMAHSPRVKGPSVKEEVDDGESDEEAAEPAPPKISQLERMKLIRERSQKRLKEEQQMLSRKRKIEQPPKKSKASKRPKKKKKKKSIAKQVAELEVGDEEWA